MEEKKLNHSPAVDRALDVIELLAISRIDLSLSEIKKRLHIPRQSLIRILNTLCDRRILDRGEQRGFYRLGMRLLHIGDTLQDKITLRSIALPFMQELAEKTNKTIELSTLDRDQLILIEQIEGSEGVRLYSRIGSVYPYFHAVAAGKIYLAHMPEEKRKSVLEKIGLPAVTNYTTTSMSKLEKELIAVIKNGYAFENQELRKGIRRVVAPVYNFRNNVIGCLGIAATVLSFELNDKEYLGNAVKDVAAKISYDMGKR
jgi:DNA-binding IclR family transcriptional regulator